MLNALICGIGGKMGHNIFEILQNDEKMRVVCGVDPHTPEGINVPVYADFKHINEDVDVIIDFSSPAALEGELAYATAKGVPAVIASTGFSQEQLEAIRQKALNELENAASIQDIEAVRIKFLGKKGELTGILKQMGKLSAEERPVVGQLANVIRSEIEAKIEEDSKSIAQKLQAEKLKAEKIDVTLPGKAKVLGSRHPLTVVLDDIKDIFIGMGFDIVDGPEVEKDYYNFEALNIPKDHPARDTQDTFYINENIVLRTQTSPVQVRVMEKQQPPIRIISPGRVFRSDAVDATHSPLFHQIEGLVVDKGVSFADLKGTLEIFIKQLYGEDSVVRFRPHHFPFTEPSAEVDVQCFNCHGAGCPLCKGEGWIEILGCGMVHPKVLETCNIDPEVYSGFAFGLGLERIAMRRYNINDLRLFFENDVRFLKQFD